MKKICLILTVVLFLTGCGNTQKVNDDIYAISADVLSNADKYENNQITLDEFDKIAWDAFQKLSDLMLSYDLDSKDCNDAIWTSSYAAALSGSYMQDDKDAIKTNYEGLADYIGY